MQILYSAYMVGVRVGDEDRLQRPSVIKNRFFYLLSRPFVVARVYENDLAIGNFHNSRFRRRIYIIIVFVDFYKLVHFLSSYIVS